MTLPNFPSFSWVVVDALEGQTPKAVCTTLHRIWAAHQPVLLVSFGNRTVWEQLGITSMPFIFRKRWIHVNNVDALTEAFLSKAFLIHGASHNVEHPLISVVTSTYRSGAKLQRAYQSLLSQSYDYWEWILWDDSPEEETFEMLHAMAQQDMRLKVYKAADRSGSIGELKFRAASMAQGTWIVELDHDDRLASQLFRWIKDIAVARPSTKFIYSDDVVLHEENDAPFSYGDYYGFFFASYRRQHMRSHAGGPLKPQYISRSAWLNPITTRHLLGLPNHVRVWNTAFYEDVGRHRVDLRVADDYELLLKTFLATEPGEIVCIATPSYFQYRNSGDNNFTYKRNALIQHLVKQLYEVFLEPLRQKYKALGWPGEAWPGTGIWETNLPDVEPPMEYYFVPEDQDPQDPCLSIIAPVSATADVPTVVKQAIESAVVQTHSNWKLLLIGDGCPEMDRFAVEEVPLLFPQHLDRIAWYNLKKASGDDGSNARNYALRMLVKTKWVTYRDIDSTDMWSPGHLETLLSTCGVQGGLPYCFSSQAAGGNATTLLHGTDLPKRHGYWEQGMTLEAFAQQWRPRDNRTAVHA